MKRRVLIILSLVIAFSVPSTSSALPQTRCFRYPLNGTVKSVTHEVADFTKVMRTDLTKGGNWVICWRERTDIPNGADILVYEEKRAAQRNVTFLPIMIEGNAR